jgi:flagellar basal body-associated protein FliL
MKIKRILLALLCSVAMILGVGVTPVFAQTNEMAESTSVQDVTPEEPEEPAEPEEPENLDPLTPEGNLTLVDDITSEKTGKQFITVVSKNGNYFYIIIDRDDEGENTVHFLNQVDEADLLNLMDEEDAQAILDADAKEAAERAAREQAAREAEEAASRPQTEQVQEEKKPVNWIPAAICVMLAGIGVVVFFLIRMKKKTDPAEQFPDPDANYSEDEDGYDLQEEADEDNSEESEEE